MIESITRKIFFGRGGSLQLDLLILCSLHVCVKCHSFLNLSRKLNHKPLSVLFFFFFHARRKASNAQLQTNLLQNFHFGPEGKKSRPCLFAFVICVIPTSHTTCARLPEFWSKPFFMAHKVPCDPWHLITDNSIQTYRQRPTIA